MKPEHFLLTIAVWDPAVDLAVNRRRLELARASIVPSIAAQTRRDFTWVVAVHPADPLRAERLEVFAGGGVEVLEAPYSVELPTSEISEIAVSPRLRDVAQRKTVLSGAPGTGTWVDVLERAGALFDRVLPEGPMLLTRVDDDDAFAPDAFARIRAAADSEPPPADGRRVCWNLPAGFLVWNGRMFAPYRHRSPGFITFQVWPPDRLHPLAIAHTRAREWATMRNVDEEPGWVWNRHGANISRMGRPENRRPVDAAFEARFPIEWDRLRELTE